MFSASFIASLIVHPQPVQSFTLEEWNQLVLILRKEKMLARFYAILERGQLLEEIPPEALRHFVNANIVSKKQAALAKKEASELSKALSDKADYIVFLKGAAYSVTDNPASLGRVYSDIDLLVPKNNLENIEQYLCVVGWKHHSLDDYDEMYYRKWAHEIPPMQHGSRGTVLDIHHNLVPVISGKSINIQAFVKDYGTAHNNITVLCEPAMFFHSAIHLFFNEDMSSAFRDMTDLYLVSSAQSEQFFHDVMAITEKYGFRKECILAFHLLSIHFNISLPNVTASLVSVELERVSSLELLLLQRLTLPKHILICDGERGFSLWLGELRGHWMKMPIGTLAFHLLMKSYRNVMKLIFGQHVFIKENENRA